MDADQQKLLAEWYSAQTALAAAKVHENELRMKVVASLFPNAEEGSHSLMINDGWKLNCTIKFNYNLDRPPKNNPIAPDPVGLMLFEMAKSEAGKVIAPRLIRWSPTLSVSEYRKLPEQFKPLVDKVLTIKPGAPTVEIVPPTKAK